MKITLIILLFLIVSVLISAEEPSLKEKMELAKQDWNDVGFEFYISPLVIPDVGIGICNYSKIGNITHEGTFYLHGLYYGSLKNDDYFARWGLKYKNGYFLKDDRSGFNFFFILGVDSFYYDLPLDPGGATGYNPEWYTFPDVAIGCGYSWKLNKGHYFRLSADAGLKILISNIYISYVW